MTAALATNYTNIVPAPSSLDELQRLAKLMVASGFFANTKDLAQACVKILAGQELGMSPVASLQGIHFINNRITYEAVILGSALRRRGYTFKALANDDNGAEIEFFSSTGQSVGISKFTRQDAEKAALTGKDTYKKFPRNMFWARAMANGCRWYCPDVFGGPIYVPEELGAEVDESGKPLREDTPRPRVEFFAGSDLSAKDLNEAITTGRKNLSNGGEHPAVKLDSNGQLALVVDDETSQIPAQFVEE